MGRGSPVCQQIREKIIEMFKNNVPQRKMGRDLDISPSTVQTQLKVSRNLEEFQCVKDKGASLS